MTPERIEPKQVEYKGTIFRSSLEFRWAVFFDACGVKWEYEPRRVQCEGNELYLPDFLLEDVYIRNYFISKLYVEVKGCKSKSDARKIQAFSKDFRIIMLGSLFCMNSFTTYEQAICDKHHEDPDFFSFKYIDGDCYPAIPAISKEGRFCIVGPDYIYDEVDFDKTTDAIGKFLSAKTEGEKPPYKGVTNDPVQISD